MRTGTEHVTEEEIFTFKVHLTLIPKNFSTFAYLQCNRNGVED